MIVIVDYGMGNLQSVQKAIEYIGGKARVSSSPAELTKASALILPGVGAFGSAMRNLKKKNLIAPIRRHVSLQKPFLGICLGFELIFDTSSEDGMHNGLGLLRGNVRRFPFRGTSSMPVPQMGWNKLIVPHPRGMFDAHSSNKYFYFVHSYYVRSNDADASFGYAHYGIKFQAAVQKNNIFGCQFHPEKSGDAGLRIIKYFVKLSSTRT